MDLLNEKVGDILNKFPNSKNFFDKYKIDFCCGGQKKLKNVLIELNIENAEILNELYKEIKSNKIQNYSKDEILKSTDFLLKPSKDIIDFIINHFHEELRCDLPEIKNHKELFWKIHELFGKIQILLESHLILEEENIFKTMISIESNKINKDSVEYKTMICSINESITEHSGVGPYLIQISETTTLHHKMLVIQ